MSVMEARLGGRRVAARNAAERRKKIILASLIVLFVALMAFQLPKLLKGSESSATAPVPVSAAPATVGAGSVSAVTSHPWPRRRAFAPSGGWLQRIRSSR